MPKVQKDEAAQALVTFSRQASAIQLPKKITTEAMYHSAVAVRVTLKQLLADIETKRKELVKPLNDAVKHLNGMAKPATLEIQSRLDKVDELLTEYEIEKSEAAAKKAEKQAARAEAQGAPAEVVNAIISRAAETAIPQVAGMSFRSHIVGRVTDIRKLCEAVARGEVTPDVFEVKQSVLNALARSGAPMPAGTEKVEEQIRVSA